ncbi:probable receptor-like serine/threonine-protein kinase At5g57670 [Dioscorea cayenensis subsp. rotundata]|uniref:Probable receptor-like serine/threonine-protein kinase At5g57670 n=1 Tax=Dioscorea cayennensis subsp. rotundata TaxID=55577 RepID=A0AB40BZK5_DIOCR|nr:probable receptor-like serine/threonine-protein kinase At5g57670 [Dioscorea cayenensis subsp. rotundata]
MDSLEECSLVTKILVGVSLEEKKTSIDLLSWAVTVAAHPNDTIVALHVLVGKDEKRIDKIKLRQAKASVISMLANFADVCQDKQVKLEAKIKIASSIAKGLVDESWLINANFLLIGTSRNSSLRSSFEITRYCFKNAPESCLVIAIGTQGRSKNYTEDKENHQQQKLFSSKLVRENSSSTISSISKRESIGEKSSPRGVLDCAEAILEECSSPSSNENTSNSRTNIWRRLSTVKLFLPFFRVDDNGKETDYEYSSNKAQLRPSWRCFNFDEISQATNDFHADNIVGRGGYAEVYKGTLSNGQSVAVKRLAKCNEDDHKVKEFLTELGIIGHVFHPNTAYLLGCCIENGLHLIFDFYPNGTLASALHGRNLKVLEWSVRYRITIGIARGLNYLHRCCKRRIIHRDIKASNVLLGADFEPQISDFGLAKWLPRQWTHHSVTPIEGTFGYLAPEYFMHGIVDEKTDVYAFGVLLLEIVTGRRPVDSSRQSLILWAKPLIEVGDVTQLVDPKLGDQYDKHQVERLILIASYCIRQSSVWRPTMNEVLELLMDEIDESGVAESWRIEEECPNELDECSMDDYFSN